ncbi:hypothetical protein DSECCO2_506030 [anaerobic digester metagenome]
MGKKSPEFQWAGRRHRQNGLHGFTVAGQHAGTVVAGIHLDKKSGRLLQHLSQGSRLLRTIKKHIQLNPCSQCADLLRFPDIHRKSDGDVVPAGIGKLPGHTY